MTVSGPRIRQAALELLPIRADQLRLQPYVLDVNKIDSSLRQNAKTRPGLKSKWGLPEEALVFGFFGRIDKQKGVLEFLNALTPILREHTNIHALLVGDPTRNEAEAEQYTAQVEKLLVEHPFRDRIHRFGHQADFHSPLSCCDVLVMPSYMENYSILILHSFAIGVPVLSTKTGGTPDLISAERGWLVDPQSSVSLTVVLQKIAAKPSLAWEKEKSCRDYVLLNHHYTVALEKMNQQLSGA